MLRDVIISALQFLILAVCQVFVLDNINLFGYINPMIYVWFIIMLPFATPNWLVLVSSFAMGLSIDVFSVDTGVNAVACVLIGFIRPVLLRAFSGNIDNVLFLRPSISGLGFVNFMMYVLAMVAIHHITYFLIETFSFSDILLTLIKAVISTVVTSLLIILLDLIFNRTKA